MRKMTSPPRIKLGHQITQLTYGIIVLSYPGGLQLNKFNFKDNPIDMETEGGGTRGSEDSDYLHLELNTTLGGLRKARS